jgi:PAS domain S-box-containing protein
MNGHWRACALRGAVLSSLLLAAICLPAALAQGGQSGPPGGTQTPSHPLNSLTQKERAWLRDHPAIRVVQDPNWPPVEFADEHGEPSGMSADYLTLVERRLGVKLERVRNLDWQEAYGRLKHWEIDMTTCVAVTPERTEFWAFTKPYMRIPIVIATRQDVTYIADLGELAGKKVAVVEGYAVNEWIPRDFPKIRLFPVKTAQEGLTALQRGEVSAYIDNLLIIGHYLAKADIMNIKIAGQTPYVNAQCMAVRQDWAILAGILDKALDSISEAERNGIYRKWAPIRYEHGFNYAALRRVMALFAMVLLGLALWIWKLAREIKYRKKAEAASNESARRFRQLFDAAPLPLCILAENGALVRFNECFVQVFGYSREDVPTKEAWWPLAYPDPDYRRWVVQTWEAAVLRARENKANIEPIEHRVTCKSGQVRTLIISGALLGADLLVVFSDLTDRKQAEEELARTSREWQATFDATNDAIWLLDKDNRPLRSNKTAERIFQRPLGEPTGERCFEIVHGATAPIAECPTVRARQSGHRETTVLQIGARWFEITVDPILDAAGRYAGAVHIMSDITERKRSEDQARIHREQLRALSGRIETLREEERTRISREIHDELGQMLTGIKMDLRWMEHRLDEFGEDPRVNPIVDKLAATAELTDATVETVQRMAAELRPGILDKLGLPIALQYEAARFQERTGIPCRVVMPSDTISLGPEAATAFFRIFQEALTNVARHAGARAVQVELQPEAEGWRLEIRDDGKGMTGVDSARLTSLGLLGMKERAYVLGGEVTFRPGPGGGTVVTVRIPNVPPGKQSL